MTAPPCHFDRAKPFYPLVINYLSQLVGVVELAIRGIAGPMQLDELVERAIIQSGAGAESDTRSLLRQRFQTTIDAPWRLRSEMLDDYIDLPIDLIAKDIAANFEYLMPYFVTAAGIVLVMALEISKGKPWHTRDPMWEFLRHCRNAVAHGGRFRFERNEPRLAAKWGPFVLRNKRHNDTPLFKKDGGMLSPGDPVRLLWDIEQAYPAMIV
jgi:hypothetical protein